MSEELAGYSLGVSYGRFQSLDQEREIIKQLGRAYEQAAARPHSDEAFRRGFERGVEERFAAENIAIELYRFMGGNLRISLISRLFARRTMCRKELSSVPEKLGALVVDSFFRRYGEPLQEALVRVFGSKHAQALRLLLDAKREHSKSFAAGAQADFHQGSEQNAVLSLRKGIERLPGFWPGEQVIGKSAEQRQAILKDYEEVYGAGSLRRDICAAFRGVERELLLDLLEAGHVSLAKLLYLCVARVGTDEEGLRSLLEEASPQQLQLARSDFRAIWQQRAPWFQRPFPGIFGSLERRIWLETGGDTWFDLHEYLSASAGGSFDLRERIERLYRHERSGWLLKRLLFISIEDELMDRDVQAVRSYYENFLESAATNEGVIARFEVLVRFAELNCKTFRRLKHFVGNAVTGVVAALAAAGAAFSLSVLDLDISGVMATVAAISVSTRFVLKALLKGDGYHRDEYLVDIFFGLLDGATLFTAQLFRQALMRMGTRFLAKLGLKTGVTRLSRLMDERRIVWKKISAT